MSDPQTQPSPVVVPAPAAGAAASAPPPRRRRRRWLIRIPIILLALVVLIVVLVQALLWSDYPRRIAEAQVQQLLHVRAQVAAVRITWSGRTRIEGVKLTLPLEEQPFVTVDSIDVRHTSLPLIAFAQTLHDVRIEGVELAARQAANGQWNLQQWAASLAKPPDAPPSQGKGFGPADIPNVHASGVRVSLTRNDGKRLDLPEVRAELNKTTALAATFAASAGESLRADGKLGLSQNLPHETTVSLTGVPAGVAEFLGATLPEPVIAKLDWSGQKTAGGVAGVLRLNDLTVAQLHSEGRIDVTATNAGVVTIRPSDLAVGTVGGEQLRLALAAGQIVATPDAIRLEALRGTLNGGRFAVDGTASPATLASNFAANWEDVGYAGMKASGHATFDTIRQFTGKLRVNGNVGAVVDMPGAMGWGGATIAGEGDSPDSFAADVTLEPLTWAPVNEPTIVTPRLLGQLTGKGTTIQLGQLRLADEALGTVAGYAAFDRSKQSWWATLDAAAVRLPPIAAQGLTQPIDLNLAAWGTLARADVQQLYVKVGAGSVWANGFYDGSFPKPLRLTTWAWYDRPLTEDGVAALNSARAVGVIEGTLNPRNLEAEADVEATQFVIRDRTIGDLSVHVSANVTSDTAKVRSQEMELLGGHWTLAGDWTRRSRRPPLLVATVRGLPLARLGELANKPELGGTIDSGRAEFRFLGTRPDQIEMTATAKGTSLVLAPFTAQALALEATLKEGQFRLQPVLNEGEGTLKAEVVGDVAFANPIRMTATLSKWPAPTTASTTASTTAPTTAPTTLPAPTGTLAPVMAAADATAPVVATSTRPRASAEVKAEVSLGDKGVRVTATTSGQIDRGETKFADFTLDGGLDSNVATIRQLKIGTLDGTLAGSGQVDLANPNGVTFNARFDRLAPSELAWVHPAIADLQGRFSGSFDVYPSLGTRPLGPVQMTLVVRPTDAHFRSVEIGNIDVGAFADLTSVDRFRVVTDSALIRVAGGTVQPFVRVSREGSDGVTQLVTAQFDQLDLRQIGRAADDDGKEIVGRLAGRVQLFGNTRSLATIMGDASVEITESDLANVGPVAVLYNLLAVGTAGEQPNGHGQLGVRLEEGILTIDNVSYFNRGVHANAFGAVRDVDKLMDATLDVTLVGSLQPLAAIKLPLLGDLNDTLAALQSSLIAVHASGTIKEPKAAQVGLSQMGETFQKVILGKVKDSKGE